MKPIISFIGAGKVATALGLYFKEKNFEVAGYISRNKDSAKLATAITRTDTYTDLKKLLKNSSIIWITTPDDQIELIANQIASMPASIDNPKLIVHASGVHTADILNVAKEAGYHTAAAHPLLAFGNVMESAVMLSNTWFAVEEEEIKISKILHICGNKTFKLDNEKKVLYHAAACMLSNYMVTLLDASQKIFELAGLPADYIASATQPLLESVVKNINGQLPKDALTGPIKRGDIATVKLHLEKLQNEMPEFVELYKLLGKETMKMIDDYKLKDILD